MLILHTIGLVAGGFAAGYSLLALLAVCMGPRRPQRRRAPLHEPVTILKPLCGAEVGLETCLRSFCEQNHPSYQIVFGIQDENDPALETAERLRQEYPRLEIDIVVDSRQWGHNRKVSNLINMLAVARHEQLVLADSDIRVEPDYLERLVAALNTSEKTLVTCLYRGAPDAHLAARLGAQFINDWFIPAVLISHRFGRTQDFVSGATIAMHRATLEAIGGFAAIADQLADDHALGERVRDLGGRVVLSDHVVATQLHHSGPAALIEQETRWMRTIRALQPLGYGFLFITLSLPLAILGTLAAWSGPATVGILGTTLTARFILHIIQNRCYEKESWKNFWLLPIRDIMNVYIWIRGFANGPVHWRGHHFGIARDGSLQRLKRKE